MRILILTKAGIWGGAEAHAVGLARSLHDHGNQPTIVCLDEQTHEVYSRVAGRTVDLHCVRHPRPVSERTWRDWVRVFRSIPADACVYEKGTLRSGSFGLDLAARWCYHRFITIEQLEPMPMPPRPRGRSPRGSLLPGIGFWWYRMLLTGYLRSLAPHTVVTVSNSVRDILARDYRFPTRKVTTVWNGADVERFRPDPETRVATRARWGIGPDALVFGTARRFSRDKGLDLAVESFRRFRAGHPDRDAYLVLVGDGPDRAALQQQAADGGVGDRVRFPGFTSEPWTVYPGFDVFVMPSRSEALSLALTEAMASGCLPVVSSVGGSGEVITDPSLGWVVPPDDPGALVRAMEQAAGLDPTARTAMRERVRSRITDQFNAPAQYAKLAALIEAGLPPAPAGRPIPRLGAAGGRS